jgi:hypothetical protein
MIGYVYLLVNPAFPNLVKIGRTIRDAQTRAEELYTTGIPEKFEVAYDVLVDDCVEIEASLHSHLGNKRYNNDREFFQIRIEDAILELQKITIGRVVSKNAHKNDTANKNLERFTAVFYHISIENFTRRIGILKGDEAYLHTDEFYENICNYYKLLNLKIDRKYFYIAGSSELDNYNEYYFKKVEDSIFRHFELAKSTFNDPPLEETHRIICDRQTIVDFKSIKSGLIQRKEEHDPVPFWIELGVQGDIWKFEEEIEKTLHEDVAKLFNNKI